MNKLIIITFFIQRVYGLHAWGSHKSIDILHVGHSVVYFYIHHYSMFITLLKWTQKRMYTLAPEVY